MGSGDETVRWLTPDEQRAWRSVIFGSRKLYAELDAGLKPHGLSGDDYAVLVALSEAPDERLRMSDLADRAAQSRSRLSHHVARLEARGLVQRTVCPEDRRGQFASMTPEGRRLLEAAAPHHVAGVRATFLDHLLPGELETLARVFGRLAPDANPEPTSDADT